jgi:hypothetical protein
MANAGKTTGDTTGFTLLLSTIGPVGRGRYVPAEHSSFYDSLA